MKESEHETTNQAEKLEQAVQIDQADQIATKQKDRYPTEEAINRRRQIKQREQI